MPLPFILAGAAAIAGIAGLAKGGQAVSNNSKAKELMSDAEYTYEHAKDNMEYQKDATIRQLDSFGELKLTSWSEDIGTFITLFSDFKKVKLKGKVASESSMSSLGTPGRKNFHPGFLVSEPMVRLTCYLTLTSE